MSSLPDTYKAVVVDHAGSALIVKDVPLVRPGPQEVLVKVLACGVCHTDAVMQAGYLGNSFPRVPGHEIIGDVVEVGSDVSRINVGDRVGGSWHGGKQSLPRLTFRNLLYQ